MNIFMKAWCRTYQFAFKVLIPFLPYKKHTPQLIEGANSITKIPAEVKKLGYKSVLVVTDNMLMSLGLLDSLLAECKSQDIKVTVYHDVVPNPTIDNIEAAVKLYNDNNCECIIAVGGGSPMDCAKVTGARIARPNKAVPQMKGLLHVRKAIPTLFAVPTTAGTGSETTLAAVVSNPANKEKYPINDFSLIPKYAVLDPNLTVGLPKKITSTTGMDALTHAVEAYIGNSTTAHTRDMAKKAVKLIFDNLTNAYDDGANIEARDNMQHASFYAGIAFTISYVGYVHALAHTLGGYYHTPHGLANSIILPYVLDFYGETAYKKLAELADVVGITGANDEEKAKKFIQAIRDMNKYMEIPEKVADIKEEDIAGMVEKAYAESVPLYPCPKLMDKSDFEAMFKLLMA